MNRTIILFISLFYSTILFAQDAASFPFIEEGKRWYVGSFMGHVERTTKGNVYYFDGDTIIAGRTCKRWMRDGILVAPIFEEGHHVWFFRENETEPRLLFDFGIVKGESVEASNLEGKTLRCYVDTIMTDSCGRRFLSIHDDEGKYGNSDILTEVRVGDRIIYENSFFKWIRDGVSVPQSHLASKESSWHDLSGRRLPSLPTQKGIYIKDGRKVLIK